MSQHQQNIIPRSTLQRVQIESSRLPIGSYINRGLLYGVFQPFEILGENNVYGNWQHNWTNLYLLNKLGTPDELALAHLGTLLQQPNINQEILNEIKKIGESLSYEFSTLKSAIQLVKGSTDLDEIKRLIQNLQPVQTGNQIKDIEVRLQKIEMNIQKIMEKLGVKTD